MVRAYGVTHGLHQVCLTETDTAVNEQRVVRPARIFGDLHRRGFRELVALALDETVEREIRVQPDANDNAFAALRSRRRTGVIQTWKIRTFDLSSTSSKDTGAI